MWFAAHEGLHQAAIVPGADAPPDVVGVGERVGSGVPADFVACSIAAMASVKNSSRSTGG
jgi:hypothetical protein